MPRRLSQGERPGWDVARETTPDKVMERVADSARASRLKQRRRTKARRQQQ